MGVNNLYAVRTESTVRLVVAQRSLVVRNVREGNRFEGNVETGEILVKVK
jgi:hypothetical protein